MLWLTDTILTQYLYNTLYNTYQIKPYTNLFVWIVDGYLIWYFY